MARPCACGGKKGAAKAKTVVVQLPGGTKLNKNSPEAAEAFVRTHPGAKILP